MKNLVTVAAVYGFEVLESGIFYLHQSPSCEQFSCIYLPQKHNDPSKESTIQESIQNIFQQTFLSVGKACIMNSLLESQSLIVKTLSSFAFSAVIDSGMKAMNYDFDFNLSSISQIGFNAVETTFASYMYS